MITFLPIVIYLIINLVALALYGADKKKAKNGEWRISEKTLLIAALFGPFGSLIGMRRFRHKTRKLKFKLVYAFAILHIVIVACLLYFGLIQF